MILLVGSAILSCTSLSSMWLIGKKRAVGWVVALSAQLIWVPYDIVTKQYPFMAITCAAVPVYLRGFRNFRKANTKELELKQTVDSSSPASRVLPCVP